MTDLRGVRICEVPEPGTNDIVITPETADIEEETGNFEVKVSKRQKSSRKHDLHAMPHFRGNAR
jgi:hypothetical protein